MVQLFVETQFEVPRQSLVQKAARLHKFGEQFKLEDLPKPKVGPNQVRLKVRAAGICHSDIYIKNGLLGPLNMPVVLGHEIAGEVDESGPGAEQFGKGNRFVVHFWSPCGNCRYCLEGRDMQCENLFTRPTYGASADGGFQEYCTVSADRLVPIPQNVSSEFAATLACAGLTSYHAVNTVAKIKPGEQVGVYGAGGVGM